MCTLQWLNSVLTQMWPFYDPAICEAVKVRFSMECYFRLGASYE